MGKIRVITGETNGNEDFNEHPGDKWHVTDGVLTLTSDENGVEAAYPAGGWVRVERV